MLSRHALDVAEFNGFATVDASFVCKAFDRCEIALQNCRVIYGYARVSTSQQDHAAQVAQLEAAGAAKVFAEKVSGAKTDRCQLERAIAALDAGDVLLVTRIDRLARSARDLLNIIHDVQGRGASFRSLAEPWANTADAVGKMTLTILGAVAELERNFILVRTARGIEQARLNGVSLGRKPKLTAEQVAFAVRMNQEEGTGLREIGRLLNADASTVSRAICRCKLIKGAK
jgi:DNA invertase Pin-like site-specific DNA recombinase